MIEEESVLFKKGVILRVEDLDIGSIGFCENWSSAGKVIARYYRRFEIWNRKKSVTIIELNEGHEKTHFQKIMVSENL
jgi:hypothetical protein